jgi:hypothetical protein
LTAEVRNREGTRRRTGRHGGRDLGAGLVDRESRIGAVELDPVDARHIGAGDRDAGPNGTRCGRATGDYRLRRKSRRGRDNRSYLDQKK